MAGIEAPWVGKTPEEYYKQKTFDVTVTIVCTVTVIADDKYDAKDIVKDMDNEELLEWEVDRYYEND